MSGAGNPFNPYVFRHDPGVRYPWQVFDRVTIAMLSWNRRELTELAIEALYRHAGMPFEFVVLDNASTDGVAEMLVAMAAAQPNIRLHRNPENVGQNRGMLQLRSLVPDDGLLLYLDNDIEILSTNFLVHLQKAFHAVRLARGSADAILSLRAINGEEHGFRCRSFDLTGRLVWSAGREAGARSHRRSAAPRPARWESPMTQTERKVIRAKVGLLELAKLSS